MNGQVPQVEIFDVFLCHYSEDKPHIREIAQKLAAENIKAWLDEEQIRPGTPWQTALGEQIKSIESAAVFVGESGIGPWQDEEIQGLLNQFKKRQCPIIPVILPSAKTMPELPWTLENRHWVDFRPNNKTPLDPLKQLIWGITGKKPSEQSHSPGVPQAPWPEADVNDLVPPKDNAHIEIVLRGNLEDFTEKERDKLLAGIYMLAGVRDLRITRAVAGSIRLHFELSPEDADKIYAATQDGQLIELGISEARLYPAIAIPPDEEQRSQLLILLDRVKETWVDGALRNSLYNEVLLSLGKRPIDEAVEPPWKQIVELSSQRSQLTLADKNIATIFDATGLLLILGEPGSGKTTTLLELASNLIDRARSDARERVPFVLNLSSWKKKQPLDEWICRELSEKYRVPYKIARAWLQSDYLIPLLDGLDEVQTALQPDCVAAINDYIDKSKPSGLVVCCRLMEYQWLPQRLKLNGAVCLEPLSAAEVSAYLTKGGVKLATLREAVDADSLLQELTQTPLMLSIMSLAYQGANGSELATKKGDSAEDRRNQIFALYLDQMFQRKGITSLAFPKEKVVGWLAWLARNMKEKSQSLFLVEGLQPSWLSTKNDRVAYRTVASLSLGSILTLTCVLAFGLIGVVNGASSLGLTGGLIFGLTISAAVVSGAWSQSPLKNGLISGSIAGLFGSLILGLLVGDWLGPGLILGLITGLITWIGVGSLNHITLVETISWKWKQFWKWTIPGLILGVIFGLIVGWYFGLGDVEGVPTRDLTLLLGTIFFGPVFALVSGLVGGLTDTVKVGKGFPNQGIRLSLRNSLAVFLLTLLILGLIGGLIGGLISGPRATAGRGVGVFEGSVVGAIIGIIAGPIIGLNRGGSAVIKHYALRLVLWRSGHTPLKFIPFLDYAARLILLKKVGGGYIFIHRMLLEYFAEIAERP